MLISLYSQHDDGGRNTGGEGAGRQVEGDGPEDARDGIGAKDDGDDKVSEGACGAQK